VDIATAAERPPPGVGPEMMIERASRRWRVRPRLRRFAIFALIALLPVGAWTIWNYVEARRFARIVDEIRAKGEPASIARVSRSPEASEQALRYYEAAGALIQTTGLYDSTGLLHRLDYPGGEVAAKLVPDIRAWLEKNQEAEDLLRRVPSLDADAFPATTTDYGRQFDRLLNLASLADLRALERVHARDPDGAARAVLQQLQLARALQAQTNDLGVLTAGLVIGRAASVISPILEAGPSSEVLTALDDAVALHDRDRLLEQVTLEERAFVLGLYWDSSKGWFVPSRSTGMGTVSEPLWLIMRPYVMHLVVAQVQMLTKFLENSRKPWPERLAVDLPDLGTEPARGRSQVYFLTVPHSRWAIVEAQKTRTRYVGTMLAGVRSTVTAIAIERYRRVHAGALPVRLDDLVPNHMGAIPVDPC
jgi:hypothetical protein